MLHPKHKYNIVLVVQNIDQTSLEVCLPYHSFIAVTSYKNEELKRLKIDHNPSAKRHRHKEKPPPLNHSLASGSNSLVAGLQKDSPKVNMTLTNDGVLLPSGHHLQQPPDLAASQGKKNVVSQNKKF